MRRITDGGTSQGLSTERLARVWVKKDPQSSTFIPYVPQTLVPKSGDIIYLRFQISPSNGMITTAIASQSNEHSLVSP